MTPKPLSRRQNTVVQGVFLRAFLLFAFLLFALFNTVSCESSRSGDHAAPNNPKKAKANSNAAKTKPSPPQQWGYVAHYALPQGRAADKLREYASRFSTIALSGFVVDKTGSIRRHKHIRSIRGDLLASQGSRLLPLVTVASGKAGRLLLGQSSQQRRFRASARRLHKLGFDHLHLDIEYLSERYRPGLIRLLRGLRQAKPGFKVSMALFPQVGFPDKWSALHKPDKLAKYLDEVVVMTYDYHRPSTRPGPVTDIAWSEKNLRYFLRHMPAKKLWLGVPAYGYRWPLGPGKAQAVSRKRAAHLAQRHGGKRHSSGTVAVDYSQKGKKYRLFFADQNTQERMAALAQRHGLRGIAIWRAGYLF